MMLKVPHTPVDGLLLHGMADARAVSIIGPRAAEFAGVPVRAVEEGALVALVSAAPQPCLPRWLNWIVRSPGTAPVLSALSSILPFLPVAPGTLFESETSLRSMMSARGGELRALIDEHAAFVECDVMAAFDAPAAEADLSTSGPLALLRGDTEGERALIERSLAQSVNGRQAAFLARLNRRLLDGAVDMVELEANRPNALRRKLLIARKSRDAFRASLRSVAAEAGLGAWLRLGPYLPPVSFRRLEISSADVMEVNAARAALGVEEAAERASIRTAYTRTLERFYPRASDERRQKLVYLESVFGLLDRVAEGQIRAGRSASAMIRFDAEALKETWLLRLHRPDLAPKAA